MNNFYTMVPFSGVEKYVPSTCLVCTKEDEAIAIATGAWLTGKRPLVAMQNSGLGNCVDIITSLLKPYDIDIDILIDNRQSPEHHAFMGSITIELLRLLKYESFRLC